jgi:hypothetical protein
MQHLSSPEVAKRALRAAVCPACYQRPPHSETLPPAFARSCEPRCALFEYVGALQQIAQRTDADSSPVHLDVVIRDEVCNKRCTHPTAGDFCRDRLNATCPLSRFAPQAVAILQVLAEAVAHAKQVTRAERPAAAASN